MSRITHCNNKQAEWSNTNSSAQVVLIIFVTDCADAQKILNVWYSGLKESWTKAIVFISIHAEISKYEDGQRRSLSVQEGSTALIECPLPRSIPPAIPRLRIQGGWVEASKGMFETQINV